MNKCSPLRSLNPSVAQLSALLSRSPETVISPVVFRCFHVIEPPRNGGIHGRKAVPNFVALYWWNTRARERSEGGGGLRVEAHQPHGLPCAGLYPFACASFCVM